METFTVKTEKTVFGGNTIAKINNKTVFIPFSLPEETLSINIVEQKNDYDNAQIVKIINASEHRVEPKCKYYGLCGGCNMMHIDYEYQKELRKKMLVDCFANNKIDISNKVDIVFGPEFNYRARFQLNNGGLSQKNSNVIVPIENCLCAENPINDYLQNTKFSDRPQGRVHFFGSDKILDVNKIKINKIEEKNIYKNIQPKKNSKKIKIKENHYFAGTVLSPENTIKVKINDKELSFDVRGFFQSNLFVFEKVINLILDKLPGGNNILDMYAGCGSISTFLSDKYENVVLVEHNRDALVFAEQNLTGKKHISYGLSGENWVKTCSQYCSNFDACVIDPPRSGMENSVVNYLCNNNIPIIVSMSCDPATQARDCAKLIAAGYNISEVYLLDFYPNTSHIESLVILNKN